MKFILSVLFTCSITSIFAFQNADSLAYQLQRNKINAMLNSRSGKFGQYDVSLSSRTGIFGLKTKRDMQKSIDILTEIIQTDNAILKETKTLLDYKTFQQEKVESRSQESETRTLAYMHTINKLQNENERVRTEIADIKKGKKFYQLFSFALALAIISFGLFVFRKISLK